MSEAVARTPHVYWRWSPTAYMALWLLVSICYITFCICALLCTCPPACVVLPCFDLACTAVHRHVPLAGDLLSHGSSSSSGGKDRSRRSSSSGENGKDRSRHHCDSSSSSKSPCQVLGIILQMRHHQSSGGCVSCASSSPSCSGAWWRTRSGCLTRGRVQGWPAT